MRITGVLRILPLCSSHGEDDNRASFERAVLVRCYRTGLTGNQVELVALGIKKSGPARAALFNVVHPGGAQRQQPVGFRDEFAADQVEMQPILDRLRLGDLVKRQPGTVCRIVRVDSGELGGWLWVHLPTEDVGPEPG
jgi:hypothetical protein